MERLIEQHIQEVSMANASVSPYFLIKDGLMPPTNLKRELYIEGKSSFRRMRDHLYKINIRLYVNLKIHLYWDGFVFA